MGASANEDLQSQIDELIRQINRNREDIDALERRADVAETRADVAELRADDAESRASVDRDMIAELQRDGVVSQEHAAQMEQALKSSRVVGAAIGLIMGSRHVSEAEALEILKVASQNSNRKLRDLAAELVASSDQDHGLMGPN